MIITFNHKQRFVKDRASLYFRKQKWSIRFVATVYFSAIIKKRSRRWLKDNQVCLLYMI